MVQRGDDPYYAVQYHAVPMLRSTVSAVLNAAHPLPPPPSMPAAVPQRTCPVQQHEGWHLLHFVVY